MGSSNTHDLGGDIFKHGVITSLGWSLFENIGEETKLDSSIFPFSATVESDGLLGVGFIATPSSKSSFSSPGIVNSGGNSTVLLEVILSNTDLDRSWQLVDSDFDIGRGVSKNSCLPLSIVQLARHDTRGEGEINMPFLLSSGLPN